MQNDMVVVDTTTEQGISKVEQWAKSLAITTPTEHDAALSTLKELKSLKTRIIDFFKPSKEAAAKSHKLIVANEKSFTDRLDSAEKIAKQALLKYQLAEEEKRKAEERKLQAQADEKARKEREKLEALAAKADASGKTEKAEALRQQAEVVEAPVVRVESRVEAKGSSIRKTWRAKVVDPSKVPDDWWIINQDALDTFARGTKGSMPIQGVEFYEDSGLAVRV